MTKGHLVDVLIELKNAFPLFYSNRAVKDLSAVAQVWHKHLGMHSDELIDKAVYLIIANETEVPTIALVNRYLPKAKEALKYEAELADPVLQANMRRLAK